MQEQHKSENLPAPVTTQQLKAFFLLARPHQYIKNLFVFAPLFFSGRINDIQLLIKTFIAFSAFSFCASSVYILNDWKDRHEDRLHPKKKHRPIAAGTVSAKSAAMLGIALLLLGISLMTAISVQALHVLLIYLAVNISYSLHLKHVALIDVTLIAVGFVLRLFVGASVSQITLSMWIVIMTFLLALFLALAKRRDDVLIFQETGKKMRPVTEGYNLPLIDGLMMIMASVVIVAYILYTTSDHVPQLLQSRYFYLTALFVVLGIMRYMQIALVENNSDSPTRIVLRDRFLQAVIFGWVFSFVWIIYS
jgi:4-hydroxybenzoate polyprenyltransferase